MFAKVRPTARPFVFGDIEWNARYHAPYLSLLKCHYDKFLAGLFIAAWFLLFGKPVGPLKRIFPSPEMQYALTVRVATYHPLYLRVIRFLFLSRCFYLSVLSTATTFSYLRFVVSGNLLSYITYNLPRDILSHFSRELVSPVPAVRNRKFYRASPVGSIPESSRLRGSLWLIKHLRITYQIALTFIRIVLITEKENIVFVIKRAVGSIPQHP